MSHSLPFFKFRKSLEREIRSFWSIAVSAEFSKNWLSQFNQDDTINQVAGNIPPFSYVNVGCKDFIEYNHVVLEYARENAVVNFITAFEVYLLEILGRMIYLDSSLVEESKAQIEVKDVVIGIKSGNSKAWLSDKIADKLIRNKQHSESIKKIADLAKCDIKSIQPKIELWNKWTYVRNSIVHTGRRVSHDLQCIWSDRYKNQGDRLEIKNNELMHLQSLALDIAKCIDKVISKNVIKDNDAVLLIREVFVRDGIEDIGMLKRMLYENISFTVKGDLVEKTLSMQRRKNLPVNELNFDSFINDILIK
jgi:hypothetical protein